MKLTILGTGVLIMGMVALLIASTLMIRPDFDSIRDFRRDLEDRGWSSESVRERVADERERRTNIHRNNSIFRIYRTGWQVIGGLTVLSGAALATIGVLKDSKKTKRAPYSQSHPQTQPQYQNYTPQ